MIKILENTGNNLLALQVEGKVEKQDYDDLKPVVDQMVKKHQHVNAYLEIKELDELTIGALWEEIKFDVQYLNNFNRIAVVGDADWKEKVTQATDFIPGLKTRYFEFLEKAEARKWIESAGKV